MRGYLLITTSGVMFFIIAAITVLHLMASRSLNQQYQLNQSYQDILNRISIQQIILNLVDQNISYIKLPNELDAKYNVATEMQSDGSVDFIISENITNRQSSFNISIQDSMAKNTYVNRSNIVINDNDIQGIHLNATETTHLVSLRSVWYPFSSSDLLTYYSFIEDGNEDFITANVGMATDFSLPNPRSGVDFRINLYFSSLSDEGIVSLYLKYSDGSIKNVQIEL